MNNAILQAQADVLSEVNSEFKPFVEEFLNPYASARHETRCPIPKETFKKAADLGLIAYKFPKAIGGRGKDALSWGLLLEELGYICDDNSFPMLLSYYTGVAEDIYRLGDADLTERYVLPMLNGELLGAFAYSEDADHYSFASVAKKQSDGYVLNGHKPFISGAGIADVFMTYIPDEEKELLVLLLERTDPGVEIYSRDVFGFKSGAICGMNITDVKIPSNRVIVNNDGLSHGQRYLNTRRVFLSCGFLGKMRAVIDRCIESVDRVVRYDRPLTEFPNVQSAIGRMTIRYESARACVYNALEHMVSERAHASFDLTYSIAKYIVAENGKEVIDTAMRLVGGKGYLESSHYSRDLADFSALITGAGTQDLLEINIGALKTSEVLVRKRS